MGKTALFAVAAFVVIGAYYTSSTQNSLMATGEGIAEHEYQVLARNAAKAGYNVARQKLVANLPTSFAATSFSSPYEQGFYMVEVVMLSSSTAKVYSTGSIFGAGGDVHMYKVEAKVELETAWTQPNEPAAFQKYAVISDLDLTIDGNVTIDTVRIEGSTDVQYNANIHTNGTLTVKGKAAEIHGYGTYKVAKNVNHLSTFDPYDRSSRQPVVSQVPEIPVIDYSPAAMLSKVTPDLVDPDDYLLDGFNDFESLGGTKDNPYVVHVKGNLTAGSDATIKGYVMFLVDGSIDLGGNVTINEGVKPTESHFAFYANGPIELHGNSKAIWGQIFSKSNVTLSGTPKIYGSVATKGYVILNGTPDIFYFPSSPALAEPVPEYRLQEVEYLERAQ